MTSHKNHVFLSILASSTVLVAPGLAFAAIDDAGAAALKTVIMTQMDKQKAAMMGQGVTLTQTGELTVKPAGTYYAVTYPAYKVAVDDIIIDMGQAKSNVMPGATDKQWKGTVALMPEWTISEKASGPIAKVNIGGQKCNYTLDTQYTAMPGTPANVDCAFDNITVTKIPNPKVKSGTGLIKIGNIAMKSNMAPDIAGLYSGPITYTVKNIDASDKAGADSFNFHITNATLVASITGFDVKKYVEYQQKMTDIMAKVNATTEPDATQMAALFDQLPSSFNAMDATEAKITINGVNINGQKAGEAPKSIKIDQITYGGKGTNMRADKQTFGINFGYKGMNVATDIIPADLKPYIPGDMNFGATFKDIPLQKIMAEFAAIAKAEVAMQEQNAQKCKGTAKGGCDGVANQRQHKLGQDVITKIPKILTDAGTVVTLDNTSIAGTGYDVLANGTYKPTPGAVYGGAGTLKIIFTGMDTLISNLQTLAQKPGLAPETAAQVTQSVTGLAMAQMMGGQGIGTAGAPARTYDFAVDAAGKITLNGADMTALIPKPTVQKNVAPPATKAP